MFDDDLRLRADQYRRLADNCEEPVARLLLEGCARDYAREAARAERHPFMLVDAPMKAAAC